MKHFNKLLLLMVCFWINGAAMAQIIYVNTNASGANDGTSWADAFTSLQPALVAAKADPSKPIWVAKGKYKPSVIPTELSLSGNTSSDYTFLLPEGIKLYGGFAGNESPMYNLNNRDFASNETILSGDLNGNDDELDLSTKTDNVYHVVTAVDHATNPFILDGFSIEKGYAAGTKNAKFNVSNTYPNFFGAGLVIINAKGSLQNLIIRNNFVNNTTTYNVFGGGTYINGGNVSIDKVQFLENKISTTSSEGDGGALAITGSTVNISNSIFADNVNTKKFGGALYVEGASNTNLSNIIFNNNKATVSGGGAIFSKATTGTSHTIINSIFSNNESGDAGGAITVSGHTMKVINSTFYNNNTGTNGGGAIRVSNSPSKLELYNSILYANTSTSTKKDISTAYANSTDIQYSITQIFGTDGVDGVQVGATPLFLSTTYGDADFLKLYPADNNPAINTGSDALSAGITNDLAGTSRFEGVVDLGAYENHSPLPIKLLDFSAKKNGTSVAIKWTTENESNNSHFILEKSTDGIHFTKIATLNAKGNSSTYHYTDFSPANGKNYYRLTQIDNDGTAVSFNPVVVNLDLAENHVSTYPNPVLADKVTVTFGANQYKELQLINFQGQKLSTQNISANETERTINLSNYSSGSYLIILTNGTNKVVKKIVKP